MIRMSSAAAELRRYERKQAVLRGRLSRLLDAYAWFADEDIELCRMRGAPELRILMRDLLSLVRDEFEPNERIAADGLLAEMLSEVSNEDDDAYQIACQQ